MTLVDLAGHLSVAKSDGPRWRLVADFLEEYRHEPTAERATLLADEPPGTGDERWDVFLAALSPSIGPRATAEGSPRGRPVGKSGSRKPGSPCVVRHFCRCHAAVLLHEAEQAAAARHETAQAGP